MQRYLVVERLLGGGAQIVPVKVIALGNRAMQKIKRQFYGQCLCAAECAKVKIDIPAEKTLIKIDKPVQFVRL